MNIQTYTSSGAKSSLTKLDPKVFAVKINRPIMAQAVRVYLSNNRQGNHPVKRRGDVKGSGKKIYRQKGTGRARHGDKFAPIFVGGGAAHGPTGNENYKRKLSKSQRRLSLTSALTDKAKQGQIIAIKGLEKVAPKTKNFQKIIDKLITSSKLKNSKITLILDKPTKSILQSIRNIKNVNTIQASQLNTYAVLSGGNLVFTSPSLKIISKLLS